MCAYEALAASYDALTYDIPYDGILDFWELVCRRLHVPVSSVLDLACGTGSLSVRLAQKGYSVLGADISAQMLTVASQKAEGLENPPFFICQPMQKLRLAEPVDSVICCLDSINYLSKPADCRKTFRRVWEALRPGGLFLFDINTPYKLRGLNGQVFMDDREDAYCTWWADFNEKTRLCFYGMDIFRREERDLWQRSYEEHLEYAYEPEELCEYLRQAGFTSVHLYGDRTFRRPKDDALRIYFAAKKEPK